MEALLILIVALLAVLLLVAITGLLVFVDYARRGMAALRSIRMYAEVDSNESLPAIRAGVDDVVNALIPPGGGR